MRKPVVFAFVALLVAYPTASPQNQSRTETGFLDRSVMLNGTTYRYQIFVPASYAPTQRWPVILFLHGAGERGSDGYIQTQVGLAPAIRQNAARFPAIAVFPQATAESSWTETLARVALMALDQTMREYQTDPSRVYLTGLSMGGNGTWYIAYRNPKRFAAIAPICGWISPQFWKAADPKIVEELKPEPQDIVVEGKRGLDGFASTNLDFILRSRGITNIALGGFLTNCCVESTMRTGYEKGYNVITLKDCTATLSEEEQRSAVEKNYPMFSRPMDHNEFIAELGGKESTAGARTGRGYTTDAGQPSMEAPA